MRFRSRLNRLPFSIGCCAVSIVVATPVAVAQDVRVADPPGLIESDTSKQAARRIVEALRPPVSSVDADSAGPDIRVASTDSGPTNGAGKLISPQGTLARDAAARDSASFQDPTVVSQVDFVKLSLSDVIASVYRAYPELIAIQQERSLRGGNLLSQWGAYDTKIIGHSLNSPLGFYENYRHELKLARNTWWGGYVSAGYRIGRDDFQPWFKERQTDEAGEFKVTFVQPLLQGKAIDPNRLAVFRASLANQATDPLIQRSLLDISNMAAETYWKWVGLGAQLQAQRELLELAELRGEQFRIGFEAEKYAEIDVILNQQLIAERRGKMIETEQKYRETGFKLSVFLRDGAGQPIIPVEPWLPEHFPVIESPDLSSVDDQIFAAFGRRPEVQLLQLEARDQSLVRAQASNELLPIFDFVTEASQDMGQDATKSNDKGDFELMFGVRGELPIQRRKARGKIQATTAKIVQINEKLRLTQDKIRAELQTALNQLVLAGQIVEQGEISLRAAFETLDRYQFAFDRGKIDLIYLNLLESKANETEIKLVKAQQDWFIALSHLQAALGLDPLDQALIVSELPESMRPGPGHLPEPAGVPEAALEKDWKKHEAPAN